MINGFEQIGPHLFRCTTCGEDVVSGIVNISGHWCKCAGKGFYESLIDKADNEETITVDDIDKLRKEHL